MADAGSDEAAASFVRDWSGVQGSERGDAQSFLNALCDLLGVLKPHDARAEGVPALDYGFERGVRFRHDDGQTSPGRIDLYKRGCFVLEAKQSQKRRAGGEAYEQIPLALRGGVGLLERPSARPRRSASWDALMVGAKRQAEDYARVLDEWPPFIVVVDVGHVIELYANFRRDGKGYDQYPDRNAFRIGMGDLRSAQVRDRLRAVWDDPFSLDPAAHAADVTQGIAALLARMTQSMEARAKLDDPVPRSEHAFKVSKFLMRCIFAMFAENMGLLPDGGFLRLIELHKGKASRFHLAANDFFDDMDKGDYNAAIQADIRRFNGGLFRETIAVEVTEDELALLAVAAGRDWRNVEPAIFGTLLEQALDERERAKLGAHYTPRAYVERLVGPTIIEPLREDWDDVQSAAIGKLMESGEAAAREVVKQFHDRLCRLTILDPACGTGNFLYVSLELMKRLEGEVLEFLAELGEPSEPLQTIHPRQFRGIEKNPRAVPIAELVLWIGYIQWWFRTRRSTAFQDPVLDEMDEIRPGDAVLAFDREDLLTDGKGRPITRQDPQAVKLHPVTGELVPDPTVRIPVFRYANPRPATWPEADFIVGNPPFIGGKDLRAELGDGYVEALWASRGKRSGSIDLVMYWWDHAATLLRAKGSRLRRFGFITTNSITQKFSRRVLETHLKAAKDPVSLVFAVPDHPWAKQPRREAGSKKAKGKKAAVRIAMTVVEKGERAGKLARVVKVSALDTDHPVIELATTDGEINSDLTVGLDLTGLPELRASNGLSSPGVKLHGDGFIVTPQQAAGLGLGRLPGLDRHIKPYLHNRDLKSRPRGVMVIDLFGQSEDDVRRRFSAVYQWLLDRVKPGRDANARESYKESWWVFGEPRAMLRPAIDGLSRIIVTGETSRHRFFEFFATNTIADNMVRVIASDDGYHLGILSSRIHTLFSVGKGGWMGVGNDPRYQAECFSTFPFPAASDPQRAVIRALAEELDALRKRVIAEHAFLTMTKLYNVRERLRAIAAWERSPPDPVIPGRREAAGKGIQGSPTSAESPSRSSGPPGMTAAPPPLTEVERAIHDAGCVGIIHALHERIDAAVTEAYGWPPELSDEDILARLVALNRERAAEERGGHVRWLRPEYQSPRFGGGQPARKAEQIEAELAIPELGAPALPKDPFALAGALRRQLRLIGRPASLREVAGRFREGRGAIRQVEKGLVNLGVIGVARRTATGGWFVADRGS